MADKPSKDDRDLVAAALGLKSSAWAKAVVHLTEAEFHFWQSGIEAAAQHRQQMDEEKRQQLPKRKPCCDNPDFEETSRCANCGAYLF